MCQSLRTVAVLLAAAVTGCGSGGTGIAVMFAPPPGPIPPGDRAEARIEVRFDGPGDSWAGRKVKVSVRPPADVAVEPAESEVTLDATGSAVVRVSIAPGKAAPAGPRTLVITATGSDTASTTLDVKVAVK